ncbi:MAG: glutamate dehydrogenase [Myxococcota bacterium]
MSELTSIDYNRVNDELCYVVVHEPLTSDCPGNGGLRFLPYATDAAMVADAYELNRRMRIKHRLYNTGFAGAKIVARGTPTPDTKRELIEHLAATLERYSGKLYTGCDLNTTEEDMTQLGRRSPYVLAGLGVRVDASRATGVGVYASARVVASEESLRYLVHGVGAVGREVVDRLVSDGHQVLTVDRSRERALRGGATALDPDGPWWTTPHDVLVLCSASGLLTPQMAEELPGRAVVSGANAPFSDEGRVKSILRARGLLWIHDAVSSAGAVIVDSIEHYAPHLWPSLPADALYDFVESQVSTTSQAFLAQREAGADDSANLQRLIQNTSSLPIGRLFEDLMPGASDGKAVAV